MQRVAAYGIVHFRVITAGRRIRSA